MVPNVVKSRDGWELYIVPDVGHHLSMFISDSLMMAFLNAETCRSILKTNPLNK
jgi:hypothetical protein